MRLILLFPALAVAFVDDFHNRSSLFSFEQSSFPMDEDSVHIRKGRSVAVAPPDMTKAVQTAAQVLTTMGDVPMQNFAEKILKTEAKKLMAALKGFSIAASLVAAFLESPNEETDRIINQMHMGFEKITEQINRQTAEIKSYVENLSFASNVEAPLDSVHTSMKRYCKRTEKKSTFLFNYREAGISKAIAYLFARAIEMQKTVMEASRYKLKSLKLCQSMIMKYLVQAYTVKFFHAGLVLKGSELENEQRNLNKNFNADKNRMWKIFKEMTELFRKSFFPGFVKEDFIRPAVDCVLGNYCNVYLGEQADNGKIGDHIVKSLNLTYPWRDYVCLVSNTVTPGRGFFYHGVEGRMILDNYKDKTILLFLVSENYVEYYGRYFNNSINKKLESVQTNGHDLSPYLKYAKYNEDELQMAVYPEGSEMHRRVINPRWSYVLHAVSTNVHRFGKWARNIFVSISIIF